VVNIVSIVAELKISHAVLDIAYLMVFRAVKVLITKFQQWSNNRENNTNWSHVSLGQATEDVRFAF